MNDPEKAKYLEENLAAIPDCAKSAVAGCQGTLKIHSIIVTLMVKSHQMSKDI